MSVKPCLLFDNSGAETQAYARLIRRIKERDREMRQNSEKGKREEKAKAAIEAKRFAFKGISLENAKKPVSIRNVEDAQIGGRLKWCKAELV